MHTLLWIVPALIVGYYVLSFSLAYWEKEHLRSDLIPQPYDPAAWPSDYLAERTTAAAQMGLVHCGDYHTNPHASVVKGPARFYLTPDGSTLLVFVSARLAGLEMKKTLLRTRLSAARTLETNDCVSAGDPTGGTEREVRWMAPLDELLATHQARLERAGPLPKISPTEAFAWYEQMEVDRGERLVAQGLACWADPGRATVRRTVKGALKAMRLNKQEANQVVARERHKAAQAKKKQG